MPLPTDPQANPNPTNPVAQAVDESVTANLDEENKKATEVEMNTVKKCMEEYTQGRKFDKSIRGQYAIDRRYAAGTADMTWAVNTNLIGSFIDILSSFLYARNPDVSAKKAPQVDNRGTKQLDDFAKTGELIVSRLWKKGRLKTAARKLVRSALSTGVGWLKVVLIADAPENPEMQNELKDLRDNLARLEANKQALEGVPYADPATIDAQITQQNELMRSLEDKVEASILKYLAIDFVASQDMQTSLDVASTEEYLDADWNANAIYILKSDVLTRFPRLTEEDICGATEYFQRQTRDLQPLTDMPTLVPDQGNNDTQADQAEYYTKGTSSASGNAGEQGPSFVKVIELWDHRTDHVKTMIDGVKKWAKEPYEPAYPSSRFYPYFRLAFFEVDGSRHPQSLSWRLAKLQDEYARSRSNFRLTRERSIPGVIFNAAAIEPADVQKLQASVHQELVGIKPTDPSTPIQNLFAPKPTAAIDGRLFDNAPILADMEKISGVQEALQASVQTPKTATEANIQQAGFASRTTSDRDTLEDVLTDLANYTFEIALSGLNARDAQRIAGVAAYWPQGMSTDDLLTMVEVEITAGSTGKPKDANDKQAWGVVLPVIKEAVVQIAQLIQTGQIPLAKALSELVKETMVRMGDDTDPERFIPKIPDEGMMQPEMGMGANGAVPAGEPGSAIPLPAEGGGDSGAPPLQAPELQNPSL